MMMMMMYILVSRETQESAQVYLLQTCSSLTSLIVVIAFLCNCNGSCGTCIAPPTSRPRAHHRVNQYHGARRQNETKMFLDHDETSLSIAAVSAPSVACSMLAVQQQKRLCWQFVDVSAARRGCYTMSFSTGPMHSRLRRGGAIGKASDLRSRGRGFESRRDIVVQ